MYTVSDLFKSYIAQSNRQMEFKVEWSLEVAEWEQGGLFLGSPSISALKIRTVNYIPVLQSKEYTFEVMTGYATKQISYYDSGYVSINEVTYSPRTSVVVTTPANCAYVKLVVSNTNFALPITPSELSSISPKFVVIYDGSDIAGFDIEDSVTSSEELTLGTVIASRLTLKLKTTDIIADNARLIPYMRLNGISGYSEWVPLGAFYSDSRLLQNGVWNFTCFDALITTQQPFVSALSYPALMQDVWDEMCTQLGFTTDASVEIDAAYEISYEDEDITMREMFSYIASAHGASIRMTKDESVAFVRFRPDAEITAISASSSKAKKTNPTKTYTRILQTYNSEGETLESGTGDDDHTLNIYNPFMTQTMLDAVCDVIVGGEYVPLTQEWPFDLTAADDVFSVQIEFAYTPMTLDWKGYVYLEAGDLVGITQRDSTKLDSIILTNKQSFRGGLMTKSTAPAPAIQQSEYRFEGKVARALKKVVQREVPYYGVTIGHTNGIRIVRSDGISEATFNSDMIKLILGLSGTQKLLLGDISPLEDGSLFGMRIKGGAFILETAGGEAIIADGLVQTDTIQLADNVDATHKLKMKIYVDDDVLEVRSVKLAFSLEAFRTYETGDGSAGGFSGSTGSTAAAGMTGSSQAYLSAGADSDYADLSLDGGGHVLADYGHTHPVGITDSGHDHAFNDSGHIHGVYLDGHTHGLTYAIYEGSVATGVNVYVDGVLRDSGAYAADQDNILLEDWITTPGWHTVELSSTQLGRINASLYLKSYVAI